jgi:hypothetical protein
MTYALADYERAIDGYLYYVAMLTGVPPRYLGGRDEDLRQILMRAGAA